jgi:hypothetical protein
MIAAMRTVKLYARDAARLMAALGDDPERWEPAGIPSLFLDRASHCGNGMVEKLTTSLRASLNRYELGSVAKLQHKQICVSFRISVRVIVLGGIWSEWQDLNLRPPRPERGREG